MSSVLPLYHSISIVHPCLSMLSFFLCFPLPLSWLWSMANVTQVSSLPVKICCLNMYKNSHLKALGKDSINIRAKNPTNHSPQSR